MPMRPWSLKMELMPVQFCAQLNLLSTLMYRREYMPLPGPPAEKLPPPPMSRFSTVSVVADFRSRHPPSKWKAIDMCVRLSSPLTPAYPPKYFVGSSAAPSPGGRAARSGSAICFSCSWSHPAAASTNLGAVKLRFAKCLSMPGEMPFRASLGHTIGRDSPPENAMLWHISLTRLVGSFSRFSMSFARISFAAFTSLGRNSGLATQSTRRSTASGRCDLSVSRVKDICSRFAFACMKAPMASASRVTRKCERWCVERNARRSMRWEQPACWTPSNLEPACRYTPRQSVAPGVFSLAIMAPFSHL
mmetsp:Transcript_1173/g.3866  ORF Transcript_1173/g.3866 Transcript_1173/m.3866 type:complete len:304 (+) Transcript_1173:464-1375(+)